MLHVVLLLAGLAAPQTASEWKTLEPGVELTWLTARSPSRQVGESRIAVLRIDPARWELRLVGRSETGEPGQSARDWARGHDLAAAINAGMFGTDYKTHVGYMESRGKVSSGAVNNYQSVAAFDPHDPEERPPFQIFDLDQPGVTVERIRQDFASLVQNLRLVKKPGENRWSQQEKMWSEAALGEDEGGRILFVFCRSPFSMHDLNRELLSAGIGLVALQHLEGGPEAQLFLHLGETEIELVGSFETSFKEDDENASAWPVPNVLGIRRKPEVR